MQQTKEDLNPLHDLLRYDPEDPVNELRIDVRTNHHQPDHRTRWATVTTERGCALYTFETLPSKLLESLLLHYPVSVFVNGFPLDRHTPRHGASVHRLDQCPKTHRVTATLISEVAPPPDDAHHMLRHSFAVIDGLTYGGELKLMQTHSCFAPRPSANPLFHQSRHFRVRPFFSLATSPRNRHQAHFFRRREGPLFNLTDAGRQRANRELHPILDHASALCRFDGTFTKLQHLQTYRLYLDTTHANIILAPDSIPVSIQHPDPQKDGKSSPYPYRQMPEHPWAHTLKDALLDHPGNHLMPVLCTPNQKAHLATPTAIDVTLANGDTLPLSTDQPIGSTRMITDARAITVHFKLSDPWGNATAAQTPARIAYDGFPNTQRPILIVDHHIPPRQLTERLRNAYFSPETPDACRGVTQVEPDLPHGQRDYAAMADATTHGELHAYTQALQDHLAAFDPPVSRPPHFSVPQFLNRYFARQQR